MKMIAGATFLAWSNRSRTRLAPTPTIVSMNSEAEMEKNGTCASPATARASRVLPPPGGPDSRTPRGIFAPSRRYLLRVAQEVDDLGDLVLDLVDARHVGERGARPGLRAVQRGPGPAERAEHAARAAARRPSAHREEQPQQQQGRSEAEQELLPQRRACVRRVGVDRYTGALQLLEQVVVGEGRPLRREAGDVLRAARPGAACRRRAS